MKESMVAGRAFRFSIEVIKLTKLLPKNFENLIIMK